MSASDSTWPCVRESVQGVVLDLSVIPGAKRTEVVGLTSALEGVNA